MKITYQDLKISYDDSKIICMLKLIYLIPVVIVLYPLGVIYQGVQALGNPISDLIEIFISKTRRLF